MKLLFKTILALMLILSQEAICQTADDEARFKTFWKEFARVVQAGDTAAFKKMSLEQINCFECLYNTELESKQFNSLIINFENNILEQRVTIPIEKFLKDDFKIFFKLKLVERLDDDSKLNYLLRNSSIKESFTSNPPKDFKPLLIKNEYINYETLVLFIDPSATSEGMQYSFGFIETKEGFKLYGFDTIP